jgi:hypothetical protein
MWFFKSKEEKEVIEELVVDKIVAFTRDVGQSINNISGFCESADFKVELDLKLQIKDWGIVLNVNSNASKEKSKRHQIN